MKYIIKTAYCGEDTVWEAFYLDGVKQIEGVSLQRECLARIFKPEQDIVENTVYECDLEDNIELSFPEREDFSYLLDYRSIKESSTVYLPSGVYEVTSVKDKYRPSGHYHVTEWFESDGELCSRTERVFYKAHTAQAFKVKGDEAEYIWEDYNYQQSYLHTFLKTRNII
jgi:hypothetical protein